MSKTFPNNSSTVSHMARWCIGYSIRRVIERSHCSKAFSNIYTL